MLVILRDQYCRNTEFGDGNLESGGERQEVHTGQAYACIDIELVFVLGYEGSLQSKVHLCLKHNMGCV